MDRAEISRLRTDAELRGDDPDRVGHSLANLTEVLLPLLELAETRIVVEIGSYAGDLTGHLLEWAAGADAEVIAIDPAPRPEVIELSERRPELRLIRAESHDALRELPSPDAVIVDGDHNYYTVAEELRLIGERAGDRLPLVILHDVCWPHGRRDAYHAPDRIPAEHRASIAADARLFPGEPGIADGGLPYPSVADHEGGARNGVLTAIEDFVASRAGVSVAVVPAFFGVAVVWRDDAPWAGSVAELLGPLDSNPILARLEANRVFHIAREHALVGDVITGQQRIEIQEDVLRLMLESSALAWGERISRLRTRGRPTVSRALVRRALGDADPP